MPFASSIPQRRHRQVRQGTVLIAVLGTAMIVAVIAITSIHVARLDVKESLMLDNMARAQLNARSGVECLLAHLKSNRSWRSTYASGVSFQLNTLFQPLGDDSTDFILVDSDGDLDDDDSDSVTLRCRGSSGDAKHVVEVTLVPKGMGLSCLSASIHSSRKLEIMQPLTTNQTVSSNDDIIIPSGGVVQGNAQAVKTISGNVTGTKIANMNPPLDMPDTETVFDYYLTKGTIINYGDLNGGKIDRVVLSANNNPFGSRVANAEGIYIINCQGNKVTITNSRIQATLVFINAGSAVEIEESINWHSFANNFPALLVEGRLHLKWKAQQTLSESITSTNFNPSHTPYQGNSDAVNDDVYPGIISGLIYTTGDVDITEQCSLAGVLVIGGKAYIDKNTSMDYKSSYFLNAPPGFTAGDQVKILPGTWKQGAY